MEKALGLELEEFFGIPAIATFLFFKVSCAKELQPPPVVPSLRVQLSRAALLLPR